MDRRFLEYGGADDDQRLHISSGLYGIVILYLIHQLLVFLDFAILSPQELLWNALVYIIPTPLLLDPAKRRDLRANNMLSQTQAAKSEALRRVFGSAGRAALLQRLPTDGLAGRTNSFGWSRPTSSAPPGLGNWDNSCYQNSVLQGLAALDSLKPFLQRTISEGEGAPSSTSASLLETVTNLNNNANNGKKLWTPAKLKSMSSWQQQDAQEYFSKIMDELDKEAAKAVSTAKAKSGLESLVHTEPELEVNSVDHLAESLSWRNPMEGFLAQRVACTSCGFTEGLSLIPFNCLTVPLGSSPTYKLEDCLDEYTMLEEINDVDCAKCTLLKWEQKLEKMLPPRPTSESTDTPQDMDKRTLALPPELRVQISNRLIAIQQALEADSFSDKVLNDDCQIPKNGRATSTKTRQAVIGRAPQSLVVHVNRSVFDELTGIQRKNYATVQYPLMLDLSAWMLNQGEARTKTNIVGLGTNDARNSMLSLASATRSSCRYRLKAVVTHYGRHENGHYICYRNYPVPLRDSTAENIDADEADIHQDLKPQWWRLSDEDVSPVSLEDTLAQGGVFMLLYEREGRDDAIVEVETKSLVQGDGEVTATPPAQTMAPIGEELESCLSPGADGKVVQDSPVTPPPTMPLPSSQRIAELKNARQPEPAPGGVVELAKTEHPVSSQGDSKVKPEAIRVATPMMRTAGSRKHSGASLADRSKGFGGATFRPVAAT